MSLNPTPGVGKSVDLADLRLQVDRTSAPRPPRAPRARGAAPRAPAPARPASAGRAARRRAARRCASGAPAPSAARAAPSRRSVGGPERAQVPRRRRRSARAARRRRHVGVRLGIALVRAAADGRSNPNVLELLRRPRRDAGPAAELVEVDRLDPLPHARRPAALPLGRARRVELLADHPQRQELVALQPQDRREPLDVVLAEEPVAAARPLRAQQPLVLEEADLRDRDVRELLARGAARPRRSGSGARAAGCRSPCSSVLIAR